MSNPRRRLPHVAFIYLILIVVVILASWMGSVLEMRSGKAFSLYQIRSILSASGIRWVVSNAGVSISEAPIGTALMLFMAIGVAQGSGIVAVLSGKRHPKLSPREKASLVVAGVSLLALSLLFLLGAVSGSNMTVGLAGGLSQSPLARGAAFLIMLIVAVPSLAYGLASGTFHSSHDCVRAFARFIAPMAEFLVCMVLASQLIETLQYTRLDVLMGLSPNAMTVISIILYWLPLPIILLSDQNSARKVCNLKTKS